MNTSCNTHVSFNFAKVREILESREQVNLSFITDSFEEFQPEDWHLWYLHPQIDVRTFFYYHIAPSRLSYEQLEIGILDDSYHTARQTLISSSLGLKNTSHSGTVIFKRLFETFWRHSNAFNKHLPVSILLSDSIQSLKNFLGDRSIAPTSYNQLPGVVSNNALHSMCHFFRSRDNLLFDHSVGLFVRHLDYLSFIPTTDDESSITSLCPSLNISSHLNDWHQQRMQHEQHTLLQHVNSGSAVGTARKAL